MSLALTPPEWWPSSITQAATPANNNSLRLLVFNTDGVADDVTAQPSVSSPDDDGKWWIIPSGATGSEWATFAEDSIAIWYSGTWYEFVPETGNIVTCDGVMQSYNAGWSPITVPAAPRDTVTAVTSASGTATFDLSLGDYFTLALSENVSTIAFSNLPGSGKGASILIRITQDSTPRTVTWPASFTWEGSSPPSVSTGSGVVDLLALSTLSNGTAWDATLSKNRA